MKNYFFAAVAASALLFSCKKNDKTSCDNTVAAIAGNYKITNITLAGQSVTDQYLDACEKDDVYQLKADKTIILVDAGTKCSPAGDGGGNWDVASGTITISQTSGGGYDFSGTVVNKCNSIEVSEDIGGTYKLVTTFTKQ
ncbi:lipocalin family protein [Lacibacter sp. H375]|uniref:lipocalin family protein n=1 Tax=Lacibacter sp. H375 TaxID=3133424 RepID=UPI0030C61CCD